MIPELPRRTRQTIFDFKAGNCWATSLSCVLDLSLEEVPNFCDTTIQSEEDWYQRTVLWLRTRGWDLVTFAYPVPAAVGLCLPECWAFVVGPSPRDVEKCHVIIGRVVTGYEPTPEGGWGQTYRIECIHDPHPSDAFLAGEPKEISLLIRAS